MKDIKPSSLEVRNRDKATAIDPWDTAGPPPQRGESEFTEHERALLDAWDKTTALSPADDARFEARLLAALDGRLEAPTLVHPASAHWIAERYDELACAQMALEARADGTAPTARPPGPIVLDLAAQRADWRAPRVAAHGLPLIERPSSDRPGEGAELRATGSSASITPLDLGDRASPNKLVVLMVAANPRGTSPARLALDCAAIQHELDHRPRCERFRFESRWAVDLRELTGHLTELAPTVLHVVGHGAAGRGLVLQDALGDARPVPPLALTRMLEAAPRSVRVVMLSGCFRQRQAAGLCRTADCVVGVAGGVDDDAARRFAGEFYAALGNHRSVGQAFERSVALLAAGPLPHDVQPHCVSRRGVDVRTLGLADLGPAAASQPDA